MTTRICARCGHPTETFDELDRHNAEQHNGEVALYRLQWAEKKTIRQMLEDNPPNG